MKHRTTENPGDLPHVVHMGFLRCWGCAMPSENPASGRQLNRLGSRLGGFFCNSAGKES